MAGAWDNKQVLVKIFVGIFIGLIAISMLLYLVPQGNNTTDAESNDTVAKSATRRLAGRSTPAIRRDQPPQPDSQASRRPLRQADPEPTGFHQRDSVRANRLGMKVTNERLPIA